MMQPIRVRLRTMMIAVAALAALLGLILELTRAGFGAWAGIQDSDHFIVISVPTQKPGFQGWQHYVARIPHVYTVADVGVGIVLLAVVKPF